MVWPCGWVCWDKNQGKLPAVFIVLFYFYFSNFAEKRSTESFCKQYSEDCAGMHWKNLTRLKLPIIKTKNLFFLLSWFMLWNPTIWGKHMTRLENEQQVPEEALCNCKALRCTVPPSMFTLRGEIKLLRKKVLKWKWLLKFPFISVVSRLNAKSLVDKWLQIARTTETENRKQFASRCA